jgi:hypothetical protein
MYFLSLTYPASRFITLFELSECEMEYISMNITSQITSFIVSDQSSA